MALLLRFPWSDDAADALRALPVELFRAVDGGEGHAYADLALAGFVRERAASWRGASIATLAPLLDLPGASAGAAAPYRYVVETDVEPAREADFNAWYDSEHMPGLAQVPGTVRAQRFRNASGSPRYHACYDLVAPQTLGSPPWLAVRATSWSDRVRPTFRNTRRTMFARIATPRPEAR